MRFPSTLLEFQTQFPDEARRWAYLRQARWPRGFLCPRCAPVFHNDLRVRNSAQPKAALARPRRSSMTALRERMTQDLILRGLSLNTQAAYLRAVSQLAGMTAR